MSSQSQPPVPRESVGRSFLIAAGVLGVLAILQLGAVAWVFVPRLQVTGEEIDLTEGEEQRAAAVSTDPPVTDVQTIAPRPTPVPPARIQASRESLVLELVEQAKRLRDRGDMGNALNRLREAQTTLPNDPLVISEMALTYEEMNLPDRAAEHWRRIYEMGEVAGAFHQLAEVKLGFGWDATELTSRRFDSLLRGDAMRDSRGLQPGASVGIAELEVEELEDPDLKKNLLLRLHIRSRPDVQLDVRNVMIQVYFYEMVDDEHIVITNSDVEFRWITDPPDWRERDTEILEVEYRQAPDLEIDGESPYESREYLGYIAQVYYMDELQDVRADPESLLETHPPALSLAVD